MRVVIDRDVRVPMRDGVVLRADLYRPDTPRALPALLQRTPYDKSTSAGGRSLDWSRLVAAGYALVVQDVRGRHASEGTFRPFADEGRDGRDTVDWLARQPWCDGAVGMLGRSYEGAAQWHAAAAGPPALRAIAPHVAAADPYDGWTYLGGAFQLGFCLHWVLADLLHGQVERLGGSHADARAVTRALDGIDGLYRRPWRVLPLLDRLAPYYRAWLEHPDPGAYWQRITAVPDAGRPPALVIGGWYDIFLPGTLRPPAPRSEDRLVIGPWSHCVTGGIFPQRRYGTAADEAQVDLTAVHLRHFDRHLKGLHPREDPAVRVFAGGTDHWLGTADLPGGASEPVSLYLGSTGDARTRHGTGVLDPEPARRPDADVYRYDPRDPVPTGGGATLMTGMFVGADCGPLDQRPVEERPDVLCYTGPHLRELVTVTGPVEADLYVSSSAPDTDFTAKLVDVFPDGRAELLCDGIVRVGHRARLNGAGPPAPGTVHRLRIEVGTLVHVFRPGHRMRLEVSSSNFPRFDPNPNTGGTPLTLADAPVVTAVNRVHHGPDHPSRLVLPVSGDLSRAHGAA
ncbi:CocE/NonD family hydrolase [Streptomyces maremycinicus]|uniref:CocE/NonD family hydrolase n=1 Tax=Streptomyces maremycinicus TaxID=1679753 RepID=UPI000788FED3|nr:CocE/NonD family hydrolase [Streptomyces sp. NBRC 110468]